MILGTLNDLGWSDPFRDIRRLHDDINRIFAVQATDFPPLNLWTAEAGVVVTAAIPGVRREDLQISIQQNTLTLKGKRAPNARAGEVTFHRRERSYDPFVRSVGLPFAIDAYNVEAEVIDGILVVKLPRSDADRPRQINITKGQ